MATKVDPTSNEPRRAQTSGTLPTSSTVSASSPKVSIFGAKSGFVIPKNKHSGSLVPIFRAGGKLDGSSAKEETTKSVQRKTKWGPDPTLDAAVRKGRTLAYQVWCNRDNCLYPLVFIIRFCENIIISIYVYLVQSDTRHSLMFMRCYLSAATM